MRKDIGKKGWKWSYLGIKQIPHVKIAIYIFMLKLNKDNIKVAVIAQWFSGYFIYIYMHTQTHIWYWLPYN